MPEPLLKKAERNVGVRGHHTSHRMRRNPSLTLGEVKWIWKAIALLGPLALLVGATFGVLNNHLEFGTPLPQVVPLPTFANIPTLPGTIPCVRPVVFSVQSMDPTTENSSSTVETTTESQTSSPTTTTMPSAIPPTPTSTNTTRPD